MSNPIKRRGKGKREAHAQWDSILSVQVIVSGHKRVVHLVIGEDSLKGYEDPKGGDESLGPPWISL
jgi:hypothetical protein